MTELVSTSAVINCSKSHVEASIIEQMVEVVGILLLIAIFFSTNVKNNPLRIIAKRQTGEKSPPEVQTICCLLV